MIHYAIIGGGRLARHMGHYFALEGLPWSAWARNPAAAINTHDIPDNRQRMEATIAPASHVLLLVGDDSIAPLVKQYRFLHSRTLIHCAGALSLPGIAGVHPLMTFADELYSLEEYRSIPFMVESGYRFKELFPQLGNPYYSLEAGQKALYHALCVMAGNFPQLLWRAVSQRMERELQLPATVLEPYLQRVLDNFLTAPADALTGPLARGDRATIRRNLAALEGGGLADLYQAFRDLHAQDTGPAGLEERAS